jgi:hypothetical protein
MKNISIKKAGASAVFAGLFLMAVLPACKKNFLERDPQGQYTDDTYPYPAGSGPFDQYIFGAYAGMRKWGVAAFPLIGSTSVRGDDAEKGSNPGDSPDMIQMENFPVTPTNGLVNDIWTAHYDVIARCNEVLNRVKIDSSASSAPFKPQAEAEAKFLRAYCYFQLVRDFGGVPIVDSVSSTAANKPRASAAQVYSFIESDLTTAAAGLPLTWPTAFVGRATSGAAKGLLAKVYLTRGNWAGAMAQAGAVINSNVYNLNTPYSEIFKETGENSSESVFEIQAIANQVNKETDAYGVQYTNVQGVRGTGAFDLGWGFNVPSVTLYRAYDSTGGIDPRRERTFLRQGETTYYGETIPTGLDNAAYNEKVYTNPAVRASVGSRFGWWMNVRILRYADVVLMYAEAANELGGPANTTEALAKLEMVRARARNGNNLILAPVTTTVQGDLRDAIRRERRVELAMEHDRFFDLVRWGTVGAALQATNHPNFNAARDVLLPIPQAQIDISAGVLTQNPNY